MSEMMAAQREDIDHKLLLDKVPLPLLLTNSQGRIIYTNALSEKLGFLTDSYIWEQLIGGFNEQYQDIEIFNRYISQVANLSISSHPALYTVQISTFLSYKEDICYLYTLNEQQNEPLNSAETRPDPENSFWNLHVEEIEDYAILMLDKDGKIINGNRGTKNVKGYTIDEIIGHHFETFYQEQDRRDGLPQKMLAAAALLGRANSEGWRMRKDGRLFWGNVVITAIHDTKGAIIGYTKVTRDFTEKKLIEEQREQQARSIETKNRQLEEFAYITSHDLQEPLRKITFFAHLILEKKDNKQFVETYLQKIATSAIRMRSLIQDILDYARVLQQPDAQQKIALKSIILEVINDFELLISEKKVDVIISETLPDVFAIPVQMRQLFTNFISNAIKFSQDNPVLKINCDKIVIDTTHERLINGEYYRISLSDNGIGFDQKYAEEIFKPFKRLSVEISGSGIGLAVCQKIVENHGGSIEVSSKPGEGTTFSIFLPV